MRPSPLRLLLLPVLLGIAFSGCAKTRMKRELAATGHANPEVAAAANEELNACLAPEAPKLPPVPAQLIEHGDRGQKRIALTFDACPTKLSTKSLAGTTEVESSYDERVTQTLVATHTHATIFMSGAWARQRPEHVKELAANPLIEIGNHSYTHPHMAAIQDDRRVREELLRTQAELHALTGLTPRYFRPPFGEYDQHLVTIAAQVGLTTIEYDLASGDPDAHATKDKLVDWVLRKAKPGSIIVMHINHRAFHTSEALPGIIQGLKARGYQLVTVGQLLGGSRPEPVAANAPP